MQAAMLLRGCVCSIPSCFVAAAVLVCSTHSILCRTPLRCPLSSGCGDCAVDVLVAAGTLSHIFLWVWPVVDACTTLCGLHSGTPVRDDRRIDGIKRSI